MYVWWGGRGGGRDVTGVGGDVVGIFGGVEWSGSPCGCPFYIYMFK